MMKVVDIRPNAPPLSDIAGQLRQMADMIEAGEVQLSSALFIVPRVQDWPVIYGWGAHLGDYGNIAVCEMAKAWFVRNLTARGT